MGVLVGVTQEVQDIHDLTKIQPHVVSTGISGRFFQGMVELYSAYREIDLTFSSTSYPGILDKEELRHLCCFHRESLS
jgi:hypothetical protein